jgi:nicotinamide-nucleotide amidase
MIAPSNQTSSDQIPNAEIISIGEELLIGQTVNTNAAWIASQLNSIGVSVHKIVAIADDLASITESIATALDRSDLVLMTGGLGPTRDDVTKHALCQYFDTRLKMNDTVLADITSFFSARGLGLIEANRLQAMVPENATVIRNPHGTAPGLWFEVNGKVVVSMPGVPFEMQHMITGFVLPTIRKRIATHFVIHKTILTTGIGESFLADMIEDWENGLPDNIKLAYLPSPGIVKLRLSARGNNQNAIEKAIEQQVSRLREIIPQYIWGFNDDKIEAKIGEALRSKGWSLATAESCTGGYIAHRITSVPGSSAYFKGAIVAYDNAIKKQILSVDETLLREHGAVSREVTESMALQVREFMESDFSIAVSGIAGPDGGSSDKPVGTVWIAVAGKDDVISKRFSFGDNRERNIIRTGIAAMGMLLKRIEG